MNFRSKFVATDEVIYTNPGSPIKNEYASKLDKAKNVVIEKSGEINLYAYINSFAESVDINVLLARFTAGDKEALIQRAANYIDISNVPQNLNDYIEFQRSTEALFNTLPVDVKKQFGNNVVNFLSQVGEPNWNEIMKTSEHEIKQEISQESKKLKKTHEELVKPVLENPGIDIPVDPKDPIEPIAKGVRE